MMHNVQYCKTCPTNEKGIVLVVVLLLTAVLVLLGSTAVIMSTTDLKISGNYRSSSQAFYIAEAGLEHARDQLRIDYGSGSTLSQLLTTAARDGVLSDSNDIANFYSGGEFDPDGDQPYIINTNFKGDDRFVGSYRVYLTNDALDTVTSTTDTNLSVILTSFGQGPDNSFAVVQTTVRKVIPPSLPGAIVLPGPNVNFAGGNSSAQVISGATEAAVAVNSTTSLASTIAGIPKPSAYIGDCPSVPCVQNLDFDLPWDSLPDLKVLISTLSNIKDFASTSAPGFTWGTTANPKIVYINGNLTIGPETGAGIILCTGDLSVHGNFAYSGLILAIGKGSVSRYGGGNGKINGSVFAANILGPDGILNTGDDVFGVPTYDTSGGGTSDITYDASSLANVTKGVPFIKISWKQLGLDKGVE